MPDRPRRRIATTLAMLAYSLVLLSLAGWNADPSDAAAEPATPRLARPIRVAPPPQAETPGIVNGQLATSTAYDARWRAMAAIYDRSGFLCGGTLIDQRTVVTAAHCMRPGGGTMSPSALTIVLGRRDLGVASGEALGASRIDVHPNFDLELVRNDIATVWLERAPNAAYATIEPLAWHDAAIWPRLGTGWAVGSDLVGPWIAGWGVTNPQAPQLQDQLREVKLPVHSDAACGSSAAPGLGWQFDPASMICAGVAGNGTVQGGGIDACQGDSGGPLIVGDGTGTWRLVGITSWGTGCAMDRWAAWTRVGAYTTWLDQHRFAPPTRPDPNVQLPPPPPPPPLPPGTGAGPAGQDAPAPDTTAPSVPGSLRARAVTASTVQILWAASSDDRAVASYEVQWHTGAAWRHFSNETTTSLSMRGMTPSGLYRFRVRARDAAANVSAFSTVLAVRMLADRVRPSRPGAPRYGSIGASSVTIAWRASTDNVQVKRYVLSQFVGRRWVVVARPAVRRMTIRSLAPRREHAFRVQAVDSAGNRSLPSLATSVRLR